MTQPSIDLDIGPGVLARLSKPGPRYTSYPTAVAFTDAVGPQEHAAALGRLGASGRPVSLYVHLPFCRSLCHYCACNVIISQKPGVASAYLDVLEREVELVASALEVRPKVTQLHLGGGTPTYLTCDELRRLHRILSARFDLRGASEVAVEVDPRVTSVNQLTVLAELGWNRASFGVQDFDPQVQQAINRVQSVEETQTLIETARSLGFGGINVDLIYGLPYQRVETYAKTLDAVIRLRPDRIALYSYAHVPWLRVAQTRFDKRGYPMPGAEEKYELFRAGVRAFIAGGYRHLGMDHFALPDDELARAQASGTLHRNFQGYTVKSADDMVALGVSAIGEVDGVYVQSEKTLEAYREAIDDGRLPTYRGWALSQEDIRQRELIMALMTGGALPPGHTEGVEGAQLDELAADGLILRTPAGIEVTSRGRFFVRNVAMAFDQYRSSGLGQTFSQTV